MTPNLAKGTLLKAPPFTIDHDEGLTHQITVVNTLNKDNLASLMQPFRQVHTPKNRDPNPRIL
jgi:hypothetical protein